MPDWNQHVQQATHNDKFSKDIETAYPDWAMTALFYSAVHLVDAYLSDRFSHDPADHGDREHCIRQTPALAPIRPHYKELKDRSIDARYLCVGFTTQHVQDCRQRDLVPLQACLSTLMGTKL